MRRHRLLRMIGQQAVIVTLEHEENCESWHKVRIVSLHWEPVPNYVEDLPVTLLSLEQEAEFKLDVIEALNAERFIERGLK